MKPINLFLARFAQLAPSDLVLKEAVRRALQDVLDLNIEIKQISVVRGAVYLDLTPAARNLVFLKKETLTSRVRESLGELRERKLL